TDCTTERSREMETAELESYQQLVATKGEAVGRITGLSHIVLICRDMDRSVRFYRDVLGLKLVATQPTPREEYDRQYFFDMGKGELFSLYQVPNVPDQLEVPIPLNRWPDDPDLLPSTAPQKLDHLSFDVESDEDVEWFRRHLEAEGVSVSQVWTRGPGWILGN